MNNYYYLYNNQIMMYKIIKNNMKNKNRNMKNKNRNMKN